MEVSEWYERTQLGDGCDYNFHCSLAEPNGNCDVCDTIDGRFMGRVCEYASTCDGGCQELTHHGHLTMDPETQLGYCDTCILEQPTDVKQRLHAESKIF